MFARLCPDTCVLVLCPPSRLSVLVSMESSEGVKRIEIEACVCYRAVSISVIVAFEDGYAVRQFQSAADFIFLNDFALLRV